MKPIQLITCTALFLAFVTTGFASELEQHEPQEVGFEPGEKASRRELQDVGFDPGDQCRCQASWESFYSRRRELATSQQGANEHMQDALARQLQYFDYTTIGFDKNLYTVQGVYVLPNTAPQCDSRRLTSYNNNQIRRGQKGGRRRLQYPAPYYHGISGGPREYTGKTSPGRPNPLDLECAASPNGVPLCCFSDSGSTCDCNCPAIPEEFACPVFATPAAIETPGPTSNIITAEPTPAPCSGNVTISCNEFATGLKCRRIKLADIEDFQRTGTCGCADSYNFIYTAQKCSGNSSDSSVLKCSDQRIADMPQNVLVVVKNVTGGELFRGNVKRGEEATITKNGECFPQRIMVDIRDAQINQRHFQHLEIDTTVNGIDPGDSAGSMDFTGFSCADGTTKDCLTDVVFDVCKNNDGPTSVTISDFNLTFEGEESDLLNGRAPIVQPGKSFCVEEIHQVNTCSPHEYFAEAKVQTSDTCIMERRYRLTMEAADTESPTKAPVPVPKPVPVPVPKPVPVPVPVPAPVPVPTPALITAYPTSNIITSEPTANRITFEPTTSRITSEPTFSRITSEPTFNIITSEPTTSRITSAPTFNIITSQPSAAPVETKAPHTRRPVSTPRPTEGPTMNIITAIPVENTATRAPAGRRPIPTPRPTEGPTMNIITEIPWAETMSRAPVGRRSGPVEPIVSNSDPYIGKDAYYTGKGGHYTGKGGHHHHHGKGKGHYWNGGGYYYH